MAREILKPEQKALNINLDKTIYGTFAEIGAGQEVARNFFKVGAAAGTIAKTMSAYDKSYSDAIYGPEKSGRYVCESRLYKMLDHEFKLLEERLVDTNDTTKFFVFAGTVSAINYSRTIKGSGWMGVRFQLDPNGKPNDLIIHVKMKDRNNLLQQEAIGLLGVNMMYACYYYHDDLEGFVESLVDGIKGRVEVDMMRLSGPDYTHVKQSLLSLDLVKHGLTEVAMFDANGLGIHASEFLYKKPLVVVRGHFQPPTKVTQDVLDSSLVQFKQEPVVAFGELFTRSISIYVYPAINTETGNLLTLNNLKVPEGMEFLYKYLLESKQLIPIQGYNEAQLKIFPHDIREKIANNTDGWKDGVPSTVAELIEKRGMFSFNTGNA